MSNSGAWPRLGGVGQRELQGAQLSYIVKAMLRRAFSFFFYWSKSTEGGEDEPSNSLKRFCLNFYPP